jgi:hypothetical protein
MQLRIFILVPVKEGVAAEPPAAFLPTPPAAGEARQSGDEQS